MQDYYNRSPEEWSNPTRQYVSDGEFNLFIQQTRRDFLIGHGIETAYKTDQAIMLDYQRWSFEHKQLMTWSPQEIASVISGPFSITWIDVMKRDAPIHGGNNRSADLRSNPETEGLISLLLAEYMYTVRVFSTDVNLTPNAGIMGILSGIVLIPGVDPQEEILMYITYKEGGIVYDYLISIPLQPVIHNIGDSILDGHHTVIEVDQSFDLFPSINGLCSGGQDFCLNNRNMPFLTLNDLFNGFGLTTIVNPYYASPTDRAELNSIGDLNPQNIERGYTVSFFSNLSLIDMSLPFNP